jgi:hypothetical protein
VKAEEKGQSIFKCDSVLMIIHHITMRLQDDYSSNS